MKVYQKRLEPWLVSLVLPMVLAACASEPAETHASATRFSQSPKVAICYSAKASTEAQIRSMALKSCPEGTRGVELWDHDTLMNDCPMSRKNRVTFLCTQ